MDQSYQLSVTNYQLFSALPSIRGVIAAELGNESKSYAQRELRHLCQAELG
jgi:hypothetical protein